MSDFILSASSTVDIPREVLEKENIKWIGFPFQIDDVDYIDDLGLTVKLNDFYQKLNDGAIARTSQITYIKYIEYFEKLLEEDKAIICLRPKLAINSETKENIIQYDLYESLFLNISSNISEHADTRPIAVFKHATNTIIESRMWPRFPR